MVAGAIIKQRNGERWLMVQFPDYYEVYYWNVDTMSGWHHVASNGEFLESSSHQKLSFL